MPGCGRCQSDRMPLLAVAAALAMAGLAGCSRGDHATNTVQSTASAAPAPAQPAAAEETTVTAATLTVADIDLYQRMMLNRIDSLKAMRVKVSQAKTAADTLQALRGMATGGADSATARSTGVTVEHLRGVEKLIAESLANEQMAGRLNDVGRTDTSQMTAEDRAQVRQALAQSRRSGDSLKAAATAGMAPAVAAALEQRRSALDSLTTRLMSSE